MKNYVLISEETAEEFNKKAEELVNKGYEPSELLQFPKSGSQVFFTQPFHLLNEEPDPIKEFIEKMETFGEWFLKEFLFEEINDANKRFIKGGLEAFINAECFDDFVEVGEVKLSGEGIEVDIYFIETDDKGVDKKEKAFTLSVKSESPELPPEKEN
jgi:hypothetical protein